MDRWTGLEDRQASWSGGGHDKQTHSVNMLIMVVSKHQSSREFQTFMMPKLCDFCLLKAITIDICQTEPWVGTWNSLTSDSVCLEEHDFFYWWVQDVKQNNHFWFCLLRGTWLFLLMGSRCQTKNLQAVLTLDAMQDLYSAAANVRHGIQSFLPRWFANRNININILTCKSAFCNNIALHCKGHTFQVVLDMRNNCWQSSRPSHFSGSAAEKCQTLHRANRWVIFDIRNNWWNDTRRQLQQGFGLWLSSF